jgi:hypothetical protein
MRRVAWDDSDYESWCNVKAHLMPFFDLDFLSISDRRFDALSSNSSSTGPIKCRLYSPNGKPAEAKDCALIFSAFVLT